MKMTSGWATWTPTSRGSKRSWICSRRPDSWTKCGNEQATAGPRLVTKNARPERFGGVFGRRKTARLWFYRVTEPGRTATWNGSPWRGTECDSRAAEGQLPLFSSSLCGADAKAAAPSGAHGLRAGHVDQSQQSRPGWRARHVGDGKGSRRRDCRHGRLDEFSRAPGERRNDGKPGSLMGCGATPSREENSGKRAGALHAPQNQQGTATAVRIGSHRPARAHGP